MCGCVDVSVLVLSTEVFFEVVSIPLLRAPRGDGRCGGVRIKGKEGCWGGGAWKKKGRDRRRVE